MGRTFTLRLDGAEFAVEQKGRAILVNGKRFEPDISGDMITIADATHKVEIDESRAIVDGIVYQLETEGLESRKAVGLADLTLAPQAGDGAVTAIMPGLIIKVLVTPGDLVTTGDVLVVLEAMKMESDICAPQDGVVKETLVKAGDNVSQNQILVTIDAS